jgi:hypothetical protein
VKKKQSKKNNKQATPKKRALLGRHPSNTHRATVARAAARRRLARLNRAQAQLAKRYHPGTWWSKKAASKKRALLGRHPSKTHRATVQRAAARRRAAISKPKPEPCQHLRTRVLETRRPEYTMPKADSDGQTQPLNTRIRRRLECLKCHARFTEYSAAKSTAPTDRWKDRRPRHGDRPHY